MDSVDVVDDTEKKEREMSFEISTLLEKGPSPASIESGQRKQIARALRPIPRSLHIFLKQLTDTHNHAGGCGCRDRLAFSAEYRKGTLRLFAKEYVVVSVLPEDWQTCDWKPRSSMACGGPHLRPGIGIHPQCVEDVPLGRSVAVGGGGCGSVDDDDVDESDAGKTSPPSWIAAMKRHLVLKPWAIVGEIGLDRNRDFKKCFNSHQLYAWREQIRIAVELRRPISVHTVKAFGALVSTLEAEVSNGRKLPPTICLHSFSGSIETLKRVIRIVEGTVTRKKAIHLPCRVFIGFNAWTNLFKKGAAQFLRDLVDTVPNGESRILLESDWHPADFVFPGSKRRDVDKILLNGLADIASMLDWTPKRVADTVERNTVLFLAPVSRVKASRC